MKHVMQREGCMGTLAPAALEIHLPLLTAPVAWVMAGEEGLVEPSEVVPQETRDLGVEGPTGAMISPADSASFSEGKRRRSQGKLEANKLVPTGAQQRQHNGSDGAGGVASFIEIQNVVVFLSAESLARPAHARAAVLQDDKWRLIKSLHRTHYIEVATPTKMNRAPGAC